MKYELMISKLKSVRKYNKTFLNYYLNRRTRIFMKYLPMYVGLVGRRGVLNGSWWNLTDP